MTSTDNTQEQVDPTAEVWAREAAAAKAAQADDTPPPVKAAPVKAPAKSTAKR